MCSWGQRRQLDFIAWPRDNAPRRVWPVPQQTNAAPAFPSPPSRSGSLLCGSFTIFTFAVLHGRRLSLRFPRFTSSTVRCHNTCVRKSAVSFPRQAMAYDAQNVDSDDDLDSEYSGGYSDVDGFYHMNTDLSDINRTTKDLNIVNTYRPHWSCEEAFRESYQNW